MLTNPHQSDPTNYRDDNPKGKVIEEWYHDKVTNKLDGSIGQLKEWRKKAAAEVIAKLVPEEPPKDKKKSFCSRFECYVHQPLCTRRDQLQGAMNVCVHQPSDWQLALAIVWAYEGDRGPVVEKLLKKTILLFGFSTGN
ncbi:hypothetical protein MJO28_002507 [Puccinia striiformis f. sp. tritici]|uniref:Uncharacterized protein n=2 Tax=Puccinia striiformis TaxID=27350 RepID=A0ACC0ERS5_9BASI